MSHSQANTNGTTAIKQKPAILFICGSWHTPEHYAPLTVLLQTYGYQVHCPPLPSNSKRNPPAGVDEDVLFIRRKALDLLANSPLAVISHSYGGIVASYAFAGDDFPPSKPSPIPVSPTNSNTITTITTPAPTHYHPLTHLIYLTAFLPLPSESLMAIFGSVPPFLFPNPATGNNEWRDETVGAKHFYNNCHPAQQAWAQELCVPQAMKANSDAPGLAHSKYGKEVLAEFGIRDHDPVPSVESAPPPPPETGTISPNPLLKALKMSYDRPGTQTCYVYCNGDAAIPVEVQKMMVGRIKESRGVEVVEREVEGADHSPFLCKVDETAGVLVGLIGS